MNKAVTLLSATSAEPSVWLVAMLGILVVFLGLLFLIVVVWAMNKLYDRFLAPKAVPVAAPAAPAVANGPIENREEIVAAVCAAVAEEEGVDISALRVVSFKKL